MPKLIKNETVINDDKWLVISKETDSLDDLDNDGALLPYTLWNDNKGQLVGQKIGVWLDSDQPPELIAQDLSCFSLIAINFPVFSDGRGYSYARTLREKYKFTGELRAIGDILPDQLSFLRRCGFDAFSLREDKDAEKAIQRLQDFSDCYQAALDQPKPLFARR